MGVDGPKYNPENSITSKESLKLNQKPTTKEFIENLKQKNIELYNKLETMLKTAQKTQKELENKKLENIIKIEELYYSIIDDKNDDNLTNGNITT